MEDQKFVTGTVLSTRGAKSLVLADGVDYYILLDRNDHVGDTVRFSEKECLKMPSYLFAIAAMAEDDLTGTLDSIKESWFKENKKK